MNDTATLVAKDDEDEQNSVKKSSDTKSWIIEKAPRCLGSLRQGGNHPHMSVSVSCHLAFQVQYRLNPVLCQTRPF